MNIRDFANLEGHEKMLRTVKWVECSHSGSNDLWSQWSLEAHKMGRTAASLRPIESCDDWQQVGIGFFEEVGTLHKRPVCISIFWFFINGVPVGFYEATSRLVDWDMIENHLRKFGWYGNSGDQNNFHNIVFDIRDIVKQAAQDKYLIKLQNSKNKAMKHLANLDEFRAHVVKAGGIV